MSSLYRESTDSLILVDTWEWLGCSAERIDPCDQSMLRRTCSSSVKMWLFSFQQSTLVFVLCVVCTLHVQGQQPPPQQGCTTMQQCPTTAPFMMAEITEDDTFRKIATDTCPPYDNPKWTNPNSACQFSKIYSIPLKPAFAKVPIPLGEKDTVFNNITYLKEDPRPIFGAIGVLINGVEVFGVGSPCGFSSLCPAAGAPTEYVDAVESEGHTVDPCAGHAAPTGSYHIHSGLGINTTEQREACRLPADIQGEHSQLVGWMFDGFGLYGRYSLEGNVPTDLDECSGHTHEIDGESTYHYHLPDQFPWTIGCYKGCPEVSNNENELGSIESNPDYGCPEGN